MATVREVRSRTTNEVTSHRIEVKRTWVHRETKVRTQIRWSHNRSVKPHMTAIQNKRAADKIGIDAEADCDEGIHPQERFDRIPVLVRPMTVGDWYDRVAAVKAFKTAGSRRNWFSYMRLYILPTWRDVPIDDEHITPFGLQTWVDGLDLAPRSVATVSGALKTLLLDAVDDPTVPLSRNPYGRLRLPTPEATGRRGLTTAEVAAICTLPQRRPDDPTPPAWWGIFLKTLFFTGMRCDELLARDVEHFRPLLGIEVPQTSANRRGRAATRTEADAGGRGARRRTAGKTAAAVRHVLLCGSHRAELIAYLDGRTSGPLFVSTHGKRPGYAAAYLLVTKAADAAGLTEVSPHYGRYTAKSWLADGEVHERAIDYQIGHEPARMGRYVTPSAAMLAKIPAVLEERWQETFGSAAASDKAAR